MVNPLSALGGHNNTSCLLKRCDARASSFLFFLQVTIFGTPLKSHDKNQSIPSIQSDKNRSTPYILTPPQQIIVEPTLSLKEELVAQFILDV